MFCAIKVKVAGEECLFLESIIFLIILIFNTSEIDKWVAGMARILFKFPTTEVSKNCPHGIEALMTGTGHPGSRMEGYKSFMEPFSGKSLRRSRARVVIV